MVATQDEEVFGVLDLVGEQKADGLERLLASIYVISKEEVVRLWRETTILEEPKQVIVLAVNVTTDLVTNFASVPRAMYIMSAGMGLLTLIGASSSRRMGCEMKISRALVQRYRISASRSWTCLPGLLPRTSRRRSITLSRSISCWSAIFNPHQPTGWLSKPREVVWGWGCEKAAGPERLAVGCFGIVNRDAGVRGTYVRLKLEMCISNGIQRADRP